MKPLLVLFAASAPFLAPAAAMAAEDPLPLHEKNLSLRYEARFAIHKAWPI